MRIFMTLALALSLACNSRPRTVWAVRALQHDLVTLRECDKIIARHDVHFPAGYAYHSTTFQCSDDTTHELDTDRADRLVATRALIAQLKAAGWKSE